MPRIDALLLHNVDEKKHAEGLVIKYASKPITQAAKTKAIH